MGSRERGIGLQYLNENDSDTFQLTKKGVPQGDKKKTILVHKTPTQTYQVIYEGDDLTPKPLNPDVYEGSKERQLGLVELTTEQESISSQSNNNPFLAQNSTSKFKTELHYQNVEGETQYHKSVFGTFGDDSYIEQDNSSRSLVISALSSSTSTSSVTPEEGEEEERRFSMSQVPKYISLILSETNTYFILDLPSSTELKNTEEGDKAEEDNAAYDYLTTGKGRNRKVINAEIQTIPILMKSRATDIIRVKYKHGSAFASNWDMQDTYLELKKDDAEDSTDEQDDVHQLIDSTSVESYKMSVDEKQLAKLAKNPRFLEAACIMQRLLANNQYNEQQKIFRGLCEPDIFREDIKYQYKLNLLWTFSNSETEGRSVNSLQWSPKNPDILAVGYGKFFYFSEFQTGLVMIWNIKNPVQPERTFRFPDNVTAIRFSRANPNLLAVALHDGAIMLINIANREKQIIKSTKHSEDASREPIWQVSFHPGDEQFQSAEHIFATYDDGKVIAYQMNESNILTGQQIMRVARAEGKLKGIDPIRKCPSAAIPINRYASAFVLRRHPTDYHLYFVGTNEGVIHKCSTNYLNQHLDLFMAHDGPVLEMKFSPFSPKIVATCGDDWYVRIWGEGIAEPLLEISDSIQSVMGLDWSPTHSTILVNIQEKDIYLFDFQRKAYSPQSITKSPTNSKNTFVQFTDNGRCLAVGDIDGHVHIFSLEDMPFPAFFQENALFESLKKALITRPDMLKKLKKLQKD